MSRGIADEVQRKIDASAPPPPKPKPPRKRHKLQKKPPKPPAALARGIRVYPTKEQKQTLLQWIDTARWTYNKCLELIQGKSDQKKRDQKNRDQEEGVQKEGVQEEGVQEEGVQEEGVREEGVQKEGVQKECKLLDKKALRARALNKEAILAMDNKSWVLKTPYTVRDEAMNDVLKAYKSSFARYRRDGIKFRIKWRSRKHAKQESVVIHAHCWQRKTGDYAFLRNMKAAEQLPDDLVYDSRLVYRRRIDAFYLWVLSPLPEPRRPSAAEVAARWGESQAPSSPSSSSSSSVPHPHPPRLIALDPGVRTFLTGYDPAGRACEWGRGDIGRIYRLCHHLDDLTSRASRKRGDPAGPPRTKSGRVVDHHRRWRMRRAMARMRQKIRDLVDDLQHRVAKWLCQEHDVVLLPEFETQRMIRRGQRRLRSKTVRAMVTWAHYRFRQRLVAKAREYAGCRVILVDEAYTSKTCGRCGHIHRGLGGSKVFRCPRCGLVADRDLHAARNILLRYLSDVKLVGATGALRPTSRVYPCTSRPLCSTTF
jgi:putative transposase